MNSLGIYEKAIPFQGSWIKTLELVKSLGFSYIDFSIDESEEKLSRLDWSKKQRLELYEASLATGVRIHTLMLSGHRRFPLGSTNPEIRKRSIDILSKAVDFASDLGIRNIQMAGYDVFYEKKSVTTRALYIEGLQKSIDIAARKGITLAIETMDDPFLNNIQKIVDLKEQIHSPWLQAYPDLGNISAWPENIISEDIERNIDYISCIHLKDTIPVSDESKGKFKDVPFGEGCVDFYGCLRTLYRLGYSGGYTIEMWTGNQENALTEVKSARKFFVTMFEEIGIEIERD